MKTADVFNVREFGAVGDGAALDHPVIHGAIDAAAAQGGGTVFFPAGKYLCGTIRLRTHVHLDLGIGAVIIGSPNPDDYSVFEKGRMLNDNGQTIDFRRQLIVGDAVSDIAITGNGTIDGNGAVFYEERVDFQNCTIDMSVAKGEWKQGFLAEKSPTMNATPEILNLTQTPTKKNNGGKNNA